MKLFMENKEHGGEVVSNPQVLIDSDAFVGRFMAKDAHYQNANRLFAKIEKMGNPIITTSMVIAETATVLSHYDTQVKAKKFIRTIQRSKLAVIHIDELLQQKALEIFCSQLKRGTSVADCANVAVMRHMHISTIFSFDKVYPKQFNLNVFS